MRLGNQVNKKTLKAFETLEDKFNRKHDNKYDYSRFVYTDSKTKSTIICPIHGEFYMSSSRHLSGRGCAKCGQRKNINYYIEKCKNKFKGKLIFNLVPEGVRGDDNIKVYCKEHGEFISTFNRLYHSNTKYGCPICAKTIIIDNNNSVAGRPKILSREEKIKRALSVHGNKYDYSLLPKSFKTRDKVQIICKKHGIFEQCWNNHTTISKKNNVAAGCPKCSFIRVNDKRRMTQEEYIQRCKQQHGNKYDYSKVRYHSQKEKVTIICKKHGEFNVLPHAHFIAKVGCEKCAREQTFYEIYKDVPTTLYYIKVIHPITLETVYKIGITKTTIKERYRVAISQNYQIQVISEKLFSDGVNAYKEEQKILNLFKKFRRDPSIMFFPKSGGDTELFRIDILNEFHNNCLDGLIKSN